VGDFKHSLRYFARLWYIQLRSANDRATIDIVGVQSHRRHHAGDDGTFDVVSGKPISFAT
jgi:hypothetical protein